MDDPNPTPTLADLLERHRDDLVRYLARQGSGLFRYEGAEDLAQGTVLHALKVADRFEYRGEAAFVGWMQKLAYQHIANRTAYWKALKRNAGPVLRVTLAEGSEVDGVNPAAAATGPTTFADRRAQIEVATRALDLLPARDRVLVEAISRGLSVEETAERLGISSAAAQRARLRAQDRFRNTFALAMRRRTSS